MPNLNPITGVIEAASKGVETVAGVFTTNKEKDAQRAADEQMALMKAYQAEFNARENRNWVDSLADGFNRLIRPFIVTLVIFIFVIAYFSLSVIIAFYFGGRMQLKSQQFKFDESQAQAVKALIATKNEFRKLEMDNDEPDKLIGETDAKAGVVDEARAAQVNPVVDAALRFAGTDESKDRLATTVAEMMNEDVEEVKKRRFGPRRRLGG